MERGEGAWPAGSGQGSRLDWGAPSRRVRLRVHHSLRLARRAGTPESRSVVLLALDVGVCGAGGHERLRPPGVPGSCPLPPGLMPARFLVPLPETALCPPALTWLPACSVPTSSRAPWTQRRAARRALVEREN